MTAKPAKQPDVADMVKARTMPADVAAGATPMALERTAVRSARMVASEVDKRIADPSNVVAECELLAAILWSGAYANGRINIETVRDLIDKPEVMFLPAHQVIWVAIDAVAVANGTASPANVHAELVRTRTERVTGIEYLEKLVLEARPTNDAAARALAQSIRDSWVRRELIKAADCVAREARNMDLAPRDAVASAIEVVSNVATSAIVASQSYVRLNQALARMVRAMMAPATAAYQTGFRDIDDKTGGLFVNETTILAARTSVGKSALATQISQNMVEQSGNKLAVFYVSMEMKSELFAGRLAATRARVDATKIRRGKVTSEDAAKIMAASNEIGHQHIYFVDDLSQTLASVHATATSLRKALSAIGVRLAMIVIDHLGLVKPSGQARFMKRHEQVAESSRGLRFLATQHECHVLGIAQINREGAKRGGPPLLHEIKDCGGIEEDTDNAFILHREKTDSGVFVKGAPADFIIAKARSDETCAMQLGFDDDIVRFSDWNGPDYQ